jgi:hypothetical protein
MMIAENFLRQPANRMEAIQLVLEGMVATAESRTYLDKFEHAGITPEFPGHGFDTKMHELKQLTESTEASYKQFINYLGSIPVRLELNPGEETPAEIVALSDFRDGQWHYQYKVAGRVADTLHSSTPQGLVKAFWASILPVPEELKSE